MNENRRREIPGIKLFKGRGKFLKKVWCCAHGGVLQSNLVLSKRKLKKLFMLVNL